MKTRTPQQAKAEFFRRRGLTVTAWARSIGVHPRTVYEVLAGRKKGHRGDAHKVAVLLGIKDGIILDDAAHE